MNATTGRNTQLKEDTSNSLYNSQNTSKKYHPEALKFSKYICVYLTKRYRSCQVKNQITKKMKNE